MTKSKAKIWDRARRKYNNYGLSGVLRAIFNRTLDMPRSIRWRVREKLSSITGVQKIRSAYGVDMVPNWGDMTFRFCVEGTYGRALSNMLEKKDEPFVFIDIGANQGLYSLVAARNKNCKQVIAFEPVERTFDLLQRNIQINKLESRITALPWAISDRKGKSSISGRNNHSGAASLERCSTFAVRDNESVDLHTFDELKPLLLEKNLPIFIKIDVEGHEPKVVRSIAESPALCTRITDLFYEVDERWVSARDLQAQVQRLGLNQFSDIGHGLHRDIHATR